MLPEGNEVHPMILHCRRVLREEPNISTLELAKRLHLQSIATTRLWRLRTELYLNSLIPDDPEDVYVFGDDGPVVESMQAVDAMNRPLLPRRKKFLGLF